MKKVQTVLGPIAPEALGETLIHEHVTCADWSMRMNFGPKFYEEDTVVEMAAGLLGKAKACGVSTVVDGTPVNLGRDIHLLRRVAEATGLNIIASSGFYYQEEPWLGMRDEEEIYTLLKEECQSGIAGTSSRPGIMKSGISAAGVTPLQHKLLHATGRVAAELDMPIFCHHDPSVKSGHDILKVYTSVGVRPARVILGHSGDTTDVEYLEGVLKEGCYIGFDRLAYCGFGATPVLDDSVKTILTLCEKGYQDRILLSHDWAAYLAFWDSWQTTKSSDYMNIEQDFTFVHRHVLPALQAGGRTAADLSMLMTENPKRFFRGD
ncbi:MAG: phosphotriesterase [Oscillospiraceae bacterium]|nr:phosphotriesterase [Oscillospiraceae bacterium]